MKEILLSDWTLVAFQQREEERRKKEQNEAILIQPNEEMQGGAEMLRSDWTIAALQKRFSALEQRLAVLEKLEEERRTKEQAVAAHVQPREETRDGEPAFYSNSIFLAPQQGNREGRTRELPQFAEPGTERESAKFIRNASEQRFQRVEAESTQRDERETPRIDRKEALPATDGGVIHIGMANKMVRAFFAVTISASIAGAIGFAIGAYFVPIEKGAHFRALVKRGLDSLYRARSSQEGS